MLDILLQPYAILLMVPALSLASFVVLGLHPGRIATRQVHLLALLGGVGPLVIMAPLMVHCATGLCDGSASIFTIVVGPNVVALSLALNPLSAVFGLTVTVIGACVIAYSISYMAGTANTDLRRYFALMNLFLAAMLTMVLAGDSIVLFLGWEMMGLCSFFLIAYNTTSAQAITAGRKAFIMTRIADAFLLAALLLLFLEAGSVQLSVLIPAGVAMDETRRTIIAWLLLGGALGKSAQVPFHTWLPSAMAGPTPVSALLHSATMVAAGAFLLIRFAPLMQLAPMVQTTAAVLGVITALFGALVGVFQQDVKRMLAYSSISQIGFMMLSIGVGAPEAAAAHFVVHAVFKSLLFLSAGDIIHGEVGGTDLSAMRGAWKRRPLAYAAFVAGAASLAGLPVITAGWWSKEAVLTAVYGFETLGQVLWALALLSAVLTATYAVRSALIGLLPVVVVPLAPGGPHPAGHDGADHDGAGHHGPSGEARFGSRFIWVPLAMLGVASLTAGVLVAPIIHLLGGHEPHAPIGLVLVAAGAPFLGVAMALALAFVPALADGLVRVRAIGRGLQRRDKRRPAKQGPFLRIALWLSRGARVDHLYQVIFVWPFVNLVRWLNGYGKVLEDPVGNEPVRLMVRLQAAVSGVADPVGTLPVRWVTRAQQAITAPLAFDALDRLWMRFAGGLVALWALVCRLQTGQTRDYALAMAAGIAGLLLLGWGTI